MLTRILRLLPVAAAGLAAVLPLPAFAAQQPVEAAPAEQQAEKPKLEQPVHAFIWKVEKEGLATSYLFGTMHAPDKRFTKFNPTVKAAFKNADAVYTELPMDADSMAAMEQTMAPAMMLSGGKTLKDFVSNETYDKVKQYFTSKGFPIPIDQMRPALVAMTIEQLQLFDEYGFFDSSAALDAKIYRAAVRADKEVGGVEKLEEQLDALLVLSDEEAGRLLGKQIDRTLERAEKGEKPIVEMAEIYLSGDTQRMLDFVMQDFDPNDPAEVKAMKALLDDRNVRMADRSAKLMKAKPDKSFVFAFGTLHFLGPKNVGELLEKQGFTVTRLTAPPKKKKAERVPATPLIAPTGGQKP